MDPTSGFGTLISSILSGGSNAIIALMLLIILGGVFIIKYLLTQIKYRDDRLALADERYLKLIQDHHTSNATVTGALNDVKMVLIEIRSKL